VVAKRQGPRGPRTVAAMVSVAADGSTLTAVSGGLESAAASAAVPLGGCCMSVAVPLGGCGMSVAV